MPQDLSSLIPTIIATKAVEYLSTRPALLGKVYTRSVPENALAGGKTLKIHKPADIFTPTNVSHTVVASAQEIALDSVDLTIDQQKEVKIEINELEDIYSQGGKDRIMEETVPGIIDGLMSTADKALTALYSSYSMSAGAYNSAITDPHLRSALRQLAAQGVKIENPGTVHIMTDPTGYFTDLLGIDRYVTPLNIGSVQQSSTVVTGTIPSLFNCSVGYSQNIQTTTISGNTVAHSLVFNKYAFVIGFTKFNPANAPHVKEVIITDPKTQVSIRQQVYYDVELRKTVAQWDIAYGVAVLDANRFVRLLHQIA